jgi:aspartate/methionine/tyrosine aminotransferase
MTDSSQMLSRPLAVRVSGLPEPDNAITRADVSEAVARAAIAAMQEGHTHYTDRPGILPLREHVVRNLKQQYGLDYPAGEFTITCGATEARYVALKLLTQTDTTVVCPDDLPEVQAAGKLLGFTVVSTPVEGTAPLVVYLTANTAPETVRDLSALVKAQDGWIIFDISKDHDSALHPAQDADLASRVISIGSLSGSLPGWRVGWIGGSSMANKLRAFKQTMTICTTSVSQWAALGLIEDEG